MSTAGPLSPSGSNETISLPCVEEATSRQDLRCLILARRSVGGRKDLRLESKIEQHAGIHECVP